MTHRGKIRPAAPWHVIPSDDKDAARAATLGILARKLPAGLDLSDQPWICKILNWPRTSWARSR